MITTPLHEINEDSLEFKIMCADFNDWIWQKAYDQAKDDITLNHDLVAYLPKHYGTFLPWFAGRYPWDKSSKEFIWFDEYIKFENIKPISVAPGRIIFEGFLNLMINVSCDPEFDDFPDKEYIFTYDCIIVCGITYYARRNDDYMFHETILTPQDLFIFKRLI